MNWYPFINKNGEEVLIRGDVSIKDAARMGIYFSFAIKGAPLSDDPSVYTHIPEESYA